MESIIEQFLDAIAAEKGVSKNTLEAYRHDLLDVSGYLKQKNVGLINACAEDLHLYMQYIFKAGLSAKTASRRLSSIRQIFKFMNIENIRQDNPSLKLDMPRSAKSLPKYLSMQEVDTLLKAAREDSSPEGVRLLAMIEIIYASGMRVTELVSMDMSVVKTNCDDGFLVNKMLIIKGKGRKERIIILNDSARTALEEYLSIRKFFLKNNQQSEYLFPSTAKTGYITRQRFFQLIKQLASQVGIAQEKVSPHVLRHSFASHLLNNGADLRVLQELLGHSDISTTQIYTHILNERMQQLVTEKHPLATCDN